MVTEAKHYDNDLEVYQKRVELLTGARFSEKGELHSALQIQDQIRKKIGLWEGSKEIRRWRQAN